MYKIKYFVILGLLFIGLTFGVTTAFAGENDVYMTPGATGTAGTESDPVGTFSEAKALLKDGNDIIFILEDEGTGYDNQDGEEWELKSFPNSKLVINSISSSGAVWNVDKMYVHDITIEADSFYCVFNPLDGAEIVLGENTKITNSAGYCVFIAGEYTNGAGPGILKIGSKVELSGKRDHEVGFADITCKMIITSKLTSPIHIQGSIPSMYDKSGGIIPHMALRNIVAGEGYELTQDDVDMLRSAYNGYYFEYLEAEKGVIVCKGNKLTADNTTITADDVNYIPGTTAFEPVSLVVRYNDIELTKGTDYIAEYSNNNKAGEATVTITGRSDYAGTVTGTYNIKAISVDDATVTGIKDKTYTGKALTQKPVVKLSDNTLADGTDYTVSYRDNVKVGTATVIITGKGNYTGEITKTFRINKANNTISVKGKTAAVKYSKLKKKTQTIKSAKVLEVTNAKGKLTYVKSSGSKKITISKKTGNVTVKKGLKKGTYKVKVKVKAAGTVNYKSLTKTVTFKVKIK